VGSNPIQGTDREAARSTSGEVAGLSSRPGGIVTHTGYSGASRSAPGNGQVVERQTRQAQNLVPTGREGSSPSLATAIPGSSNGRTAGTEPANVGSIPAPGAWNAILGVWRRHTILRRSEVRFDSSRGCLVPVARARGLCWVPALALRACAGDARQVGHRSRKAGRVGSSPTAGSD
jgi:hypothetical protein